MAKRKKKKKKQSKKPAKRGPKIIQLDWVVMDKLLGLGSTLRECSEWFTCSEDTIERRVKEEKGMLFAEYQERKAAGFKISLRRKQYEVAMGDRKSKPSVNMLIWLGKQLLGQSEKTLIADAYDDFDI